jgi:hypothetical protein
LAWAWCGGHRGSADKTPQIRQGFGNFLISSPILSFESDRWSVEDSGHSLSAVDTRWLMLFSFYASGNGNSHRAVRAFVFVGRH